MKKKVWELTVLDNPNRAVGGESDVFYTTDTEAFLIFRLTDEDFNPATATLTLVNTSDKSVISETVPVIDKEIEWEMTEEAIVHSGNWQAQLVYTQEKAGKAEHYTSQVVQFDVQSHLMTGRQPALVAIEDWNTFMATAQDLLDSFSEDADGKMFDIDELEQQYRDSEQARVEAENVRETNESARQAKESQRASSESTRIDNEQQRESNESLRESSENDRANAEQNRVTAENERSDLYDLVQQKLADGEFVGEKGDTGDGLEYVWNGTQLGVRKEGETEYVYVDLKGDKGDTGEIENLDSSHIVDALGYMPISEADVPDPTWENLQNKPTEFNPTTHTHSWDGIANKPSSFTPSTHTHSIDDVTGLRAELDSVPELTKENVGLGNVDNVKQASKVEHDQLASDFNEHQAEEVHQGEVHGMRVVDDKFEFFNGTEWVELKGGGGSSVRLGNVLDLTIEPLVGNKIKITWADPEDVILEGVTLAQWKGTQLRRKLNTYPIDEKDGELITNNVVRNQYVDGYLDEDLSSGQRYYYALFPYTLDDVYTVDVANRVDVIAFEKYEQSPPIKPVVGNLGALKATVSSDVGSVVSLNQVDWFASPHEFVDLVENEVYTPYAKFEETSDKWESIIVRGDTFVAINKLPQNPPPAPSISNLEFNKVTVTGISGTEVRLGSGEWLDSPQTFTGLIAETTYQVYARMKETEDKFPSDSSVVKSFTTPSDLPGPSDLVGGNMDAGFFGHVPASKLFTGSEIAAAVGITQGTAQFNDVGWLKIASEGKIKYKSQKPFRHSISWDHINSKGAVDGSKIIEKDGVRYKVTLMKGGNGNVNDSVNGPKASEWNKVMLPMHERAKDQSWNFKDNVDIPTEDWGVGFTDADLHTHNSHGSGTYQWCREVYYDNASHRVFRGYAGVSYSSWATSSGTHSGYGWSPVLEVVS